MDREIVIVVPTESAAYEVVRALGTLDDEGSIELYSSTVIMKNANGEMEVKDKRPPVPWGAALGLPTGALIGLLAGPMGAAVGAAIGGAAGLGGDLAYSGFAGEFLHDVSGRLQPGAYAVCASVWEDWTAPVDAAVAPLGGAVLRQATQDIAIAQIRGQMQELSDEQAHLEAEIARASGDAKAKLEAKRGELAAKQTAQRKRLQERVDKLQESWDAKIASIKQKLAAAKAEAKERHQQHVEKLERFSEQQKKSFTQLFA